MIKNNIHDDMLLYSLHDCVTSEIKCIDNTLVFLFEKSKLSEDMLDINRISADARQLEVTYFLSSKLSKNKESIVVKQVNRNKILRKNIFAQLTLAEFLQYLESNKYDLVIYNHYFNCQQCLIISEVSGKDGWQLGNEFYIELLIDKVTFNWR